MTEDCTVGVGTCETKTDNTEVDGTDVTGTDDGTGDGTVEAGADTEVGGTDVTGTDTEVDGTVETDAGCMGADTEVETVETGGEDVLDGQFRATCPDCRHFKHLISCIKRSHIIKSDGKEDLNCTKRSIKSETEEQNFSSCKSELLNFQTPRPC